jgi:hypothetical protein
MIPAMTSTESETAVPIGQLQTDTFCQACGYNLHAQVVSRDQRLNLLVCRCPECGQFAAAGHGVTIGRVWLNRFATLLLFIWVMFLFFGFGLSTLFLGMLPYAHLRTSTHWQEAVEWNLQSRTWVTRYVYSIEPGHTLTPEEIRQERYALFMIEATAGTLAVLVGIFHSVFFWHVKGATRALAFVFPLISFMGASAFWLLNPMARFLRGWGIATLCVDLLFQCACVVAGLAFGRPIARALLRWFIPPKPRQHLAFLWTTDGKKLPV